MATQVLWKYVFEVTFLQRRYYIPYCMFHSSFKVKCPMSGDKMRFQYVAMAMFYYVGTGMFCCIFIMLHQVHIAAVQN